MRHFERSARGFFLLALCVFASACGAPHDGFYDRDHHRWYHEHQWHDCGEHDEHCR